MEESLELNQCMDKLQQLQGLDNSFDKRFVRFRFDLLDFDHELWGWKTLTVEQHVHFLKFMQDIEKQTWAEVKWAAGGRNHGTNHHSLEVSKFDKKAQKRLQELNLSSLVGESLFSMRLNNITRIYGMREDQFFLPIWHDPHHDSQEKAVYPQIK